MQLRDRQYSVVGKCKTSYEYVVSDNPACAGQCLCEKYHPKRHNISRCEAEANELKKKVPETIKDTIAAHDDSLFSERTGKLQTGLTCHHYFNSDTLHLISTGIQLKIISLNELRTLKLHQKNTRLPTLLVPKPTYQNPGERRKTKGKQEKGVLWLWKIKIVELLLFFFHWGGGGGGRGTPIDGECESDKYGVLHIDNVDLDVLAFFTSHTDKACLEEDLLNSKCRLHWRS